MGKSVLIVDDCATTRRLVGLYLKQEGFSLVQAENGIEALEKLARSSVDLVITDMNMPQMDGVSLTRALKQDQAYASIPVVMLTTEDAAIEREQGMAAGAAAYLVKPIKQQHLVQEVKRVLSEAIA
jgi:two-component system chemotaxis response regulator CheY